MVAAMTCQASLLSFKTKSVNSASVPLQQPLGFSRPQTATFASSGALAYGSDLVQNTVKKVTAKLEEVDPEETFSSLFGKPVKQRSGQPAFRSALEQVSYETNGFLNQDKAAKRKTVVARVAGIFGRK